jgi:hypothetical protein
LVKNSGSPVWMTLPTLPVPKGSLRASSLVWVSWNCLFLGLVLPPEGGGVVDVLEGDVVALDQVERHRLRLEGLDDLGGGELDHGCQILAAGGRLGDDLDEEGAAQRAGDIGVKP